MSVSDSKTEFAETYLVGKRDFNSFFVTVCRKGLKPERLEDFRSAEQARAWVKERAQAMNSRMQNNEQTSSA